MFLSTLQEKRYLTSFGPCAARTLTKCYYWLAPVGASYSVAYVVTSAVLAFLTKADFRNGILFGAWLEAARNVIRS